MDEKTWTALNACIIAAENSRNNHANTQAEIAREWLDTQEWTDAPVGE